LFKDCGEEALERVSNFKYRAFISYSHRDTSFARWLHGALERYRVDGDLVGRKNSTGILPKSLRPIFRDRDEFSAGHSLTEQTLAALDESQFLIVLCSPSAAISKYVNEEVRYFKANGGASRLIPIIVDGEPGDAQRECFSPALRFKLGPDGALTDEPEEPLAADARPQGDGKEIAKQKVIAGLLGLGLDEILRRAERARKRRTRFVAGLAAAFLLLAVAAAGSAVYAYQKLAESNERLDEAIEIAYGIVTKATAMSDRYGVPQELTLDLLGQAESALNGLMARGADTAMLRHRKALMQVSFSDSYRLLGRFDDAMRRAAEAHGLLVDLTKRNPNKVEWQNELAIAEYKIGDIQMYRGHFVEALEGFRASVQLFKRYPDQKSSGALTFSGEGSASYYQFWATTWLGWMQSYVGDADAALANVEIGRDLAERVVSENPNDAIGRRNLALSHLVICMIMHTRGDYTEAIGHCRTAEAAMKRLVAENSGNSRWQRDLAWSEIHLAATLTKLGFVDEAIDALQSAISIAERLVTTDAKNVLWTSHLWISYFQKAQAELSLGKIDETLAKCRAALTLVEPQALRDAGYFWFRRQLAWSHFCIGDAQKAHSKLDESLESYRRGFELIAELAQLDTKSALRKSDLAWGYIKVGDVLSALGRKDEAVADFRQAGALAGQIADADPNNADWESVLLWAEWRLSEQGVDSVARLSDIVARMRRLKNENRLSADLARLLPIAEGRLARLGSG
jgi:tetratricopeptide (TPR) repeat protein